MGDYDIKNATLIVIIRILTYQLFGKNIYERRTGTTYERNDFKDCFKGRTKTKRIRHVLNG